MYPSLSIIDTAGERSQQLLTEDTSHHRLAVEPRRTHRGLRQLPDPHRALNVIPVGTADETVLVHARQVVAVAVRAVRAALSWVADLPCDSRDRLRAREQDLAVLGITWVRDPDDDALAREIALAQQRRRALDVPARGAAAAAGPDSPPPTARGPRRSSAVGREWDHRMAIQVS
jgi:hypothetical protein